MDSVETKTPRERHGVRFGKFRVADGRRETLGRFVVFLDDGGEKNKKWTRWKQELLRNDTTFVSRDSEQLTVESGCREARVGIFVHTDVGGEKSKKWTRWK